MLPSNQIMMSWQMMLGQVVCLSAASWCPKDMKVALMGSIPDPIDLHVHGAGGALLFDNAIDGWKWNCQLVWEWLVGDGPFWQVWCRHFAKTN
jgi:hypothetical protein